ncbi:MAG: hypothetical protein QM698_05735 [Micropepsaceae bacterium]
MPHNFGTLLALILLVGGAVWFFNRPPPPALPPCDAPQQVNAMLDQLADAGTTKIDETRERAIRSHMSLTAIAEDADAGDKNSRVCDATLAIAARRAGPANAYRVRYAIERPRSGGDTAPRLTDLRRTQLPRCDTPDLFADAIMLTGLWPERSVGASVAFSDMQEVSFDDAAQKRRCAGRVRGALDPPTGGRDFTGLISWLDRETGELMIEARLE